MKKNLCLVFIALLLSCQTKQEKKLVSDEIMYNMINFVLDSELSLTEKDKKQNFVTEGFSIILRPGETEYFEIDKMDSIFTKEDITFIHKQINERMKFRLDSNLIKNHKVIPFESLNKLRGNDESSGLFWERFYKKYNAKSFNSIDLPLFSSDKKTVIISYGFNCGSLCGGGETAIFKLIQGKWKKIKTISTWVS